MRLARAVGPSLLVLTVLAGCGGSAKGAVSLGSGAAGDVARLLGVTVTDLEVPPSVLDDVASRSGLAVDDVKLVADDVARESGWHQVTNRASLLRNQHFPHEDVVAVATEAACAGFEADRDPTLGDVNTAVAYRFGTMPTPVELQELVVATRDLHEGMRDAAAEGEHAWASVLLYCYVFSDIPGMG